jgi:hypothetical protein
MTLFILFSFLILNLYNATFSNSQYLASNDTVISEWTLRESKQS